MTRQATSTSGSASVAAAPPSHAGTWRWTLGSLFMLVANPLLRREFIATLRTRRAFWLLLVGVIFATLIPLIAWPNPGTILINPRRGREIFWVSMIVQLIAAGVMIPAFTAASFAGERERDTIELLYSTFLSPLAILAAKFFASVGYLLIFVIAVSPTVCLLYLQGSLEFSDLVESYSCLIAAIVSMTLVCLTCSVRSRKTVYAMIRGVVWVFLWGGGFMMFFALVVAVFQELFGGGGRPPDVLFIAVLSSPLAAVVAAFEPMPVTLPVSWTTTDVYLIWASLLGGGHLVYLLWKARTPSLAPRGRPLWKRLFAAPGVKPVARPRRVRRPWTVKGIVALGERGWPVVRNPIFLKEIRSEFFGRPWFRHVMIWPLGVILALLLLTPGSFSDKYSAACCIALGVVYLLYPGMLATGLPREIEPGSIDLLRGTLTSMRSILWGKTLASLYGVAGIFAVTSVITGCFALIGIPFPDAHTPSYSSGSRYRLEPVHTAAMVLCVACYTGFVLSVSLAFISALSAFFSAVCKRSISALLGAYGSMLGFVMALPMFFGLIVEVTRAPWRTWEPLVMGVSPFTTLTHGVYTIHRSFLPNWGANEESAVMGVVIFTMFYSLLTLVLAAATIYLVQARQARDA